MSKSARGQPQRLPVSIIPKTVERHSEAGDVAQSARTHFRPFSDTLTVPESGRSFTAVGVADMVCCPRRRSFVRSGYGDAATHKGTLLEQASGAGTVAAKPMFGKYGL